MKQETGRRIARWGYMAVAAGYLWWNLARMTEFSWTFTIMPYLGDFGIIAAILSLILGWKKRSPLVWTMTAGLGWMLLMSAIRGENVLAAEWQYLKEGIIAFLVLAPLPGCLTENRFRQFLKGTIAVWMTAITCQAAIGLWAAISGHAVFSMKGTWYIGMNLGDHRLYLNAYVTTAAAKMGMTVLLTAILFALSRTKRAKIACVMAILVQCGALALTDCRTAFVALGVAAGFCVWTLLGAKVHMPSKLNHRLMLPMLMAAGIILCYGLLTGVLTLLAPSVAPGPLDNVNLLEFPAHLMTEASAEQEVILDSTPVHRSIDTTDAFNGRWGIWKGALFNSVCKSRFTGAGAAGAAADGHKRAAGGRNDEFVHASRHKILPTCAQSVLTDACQLGDSRSADSAGCDFHLLHADGADSQAQSAALGADAAHPGNLPAGLRVGGLLHDAIDGFANALLALSADGRGGCTGAAAEATSASEITNGYKFALWEVKPSDGRYHHPCVQCT